MRQKLTATTIGTAAVTFFPGLVLAQVLNDNNRYGCGPSHDGMGRRLEVSDVGFDSGR